MPDAQNTDAPPTDTDATAIPTNRPPLSGFAFAAPLAPGEVGVIGPYRLVKQLGKGGMGAVYLAIDTRLERKLALKVMLPELAADPDAKERFLREARAVAKIAHDNVVTVFEADERAGLPYIAMQFLQGYPLDDYLRAKGSPPLAHCVRIGIEAARGLAAAHELGLVHRDIKPANLWLEAPNGRVKVLDFGLAKPIDTDTELTKSGAVMGTPAYMSPEQARASKVDHRTDIFSLGVVMYKLLTGHNPFVGANVMAVLMALGMEEPTPIRERNPNVPEALAAFVMRMLAKKPDARPQTALEVAHGLRAALAQPAASADVSQSLPVVVHALPQPVQPMHVTIAPESAFANLLDDEDAAPTERAAEPVREPAVAPTRGKGLLIACGALALVAAVGAAIALGTGGKKPDDSAKNNPNPPPKKDKPAPPKVEPKPPAVPDTGEPFVPLTPASETDWNKLWVAHGARDWKLQDGKLTNGSAANRGWIGTKTEYTDFEIELEYKFGAKGDTGVFLRAWAEGEISGSQFVEVQLMDDDGFKEFKFPAVSATGAVFGRVPPNPVPVAKPNEWNRATVRAMGTRVTVTVNGTKCADADVEFPRAKGVIGFQQWETAVEFRNVRVRDLSDPHRAAAEWVLSVGGVVRLEGSETDARAVADLPKGPFRVRSVNVPKGVTGDGLALLRRCSPLNAISLDGSDVTDAAFAQLAGTSVNHVLVVNTALGDDALAVVKALVDLHDVHFENTRATDKGLAHLKGAKLNGLYLSGTGVTDEGLKALAALDDPHHVFLDGTKVTDAGVKKLALALPNCRIIWDGGTIEPKGTADSDRGAAEWVLSAGGGVRVDGNDTEIRAGADLPKGAFRLTYAALNDSKAVTADGLRLVARCPKLGLVFLRNTNVTDADVLKLAGAPLNHLYLGQTGIGDDALAVVKTFPNLHDLNLTDTRLTDKGMAHFAGVQLRGLYLANTGLTDEGLKALAALGSVVAIDVKGTKVTEVGVKKLAAALPGCRITWDGGTIEPKK